MILFVNGDSTVAGYEMAPPGTTFDVIAKSPVPPLTLDELLSYQEKSRWSTLVAEALGLDCVNIAKAGSSNDRIFRTTLEWISGNLDEIKQTSPLVVIGWTHVSRAEFFVEKTGRFENFGVNFTVNFPLQQKAFETLVTRVHGNLALWQYKVSLHGILRNLGVRHLFFDSYERPDENQLSVMIDELAIMPSVMREYCSDCPVGRGGHFLEAGHAKWAKLITREITGRL